MLQLFHYCEAWRDTVFTHCTEELKREKEV